MLLTPSFLTQDDEWDAIMANIPDELFGGQIMKEGASQEVREPAQDFKSFWGAYSYVWLMLMHPTLWFLE